MSARQERDWRLYADDILQACAKVRHIVAGMTYEAFVADEIRVDATLRNWRRSRETAKPRSSHPRALRESRACAGRGGRLGRPSQRPRPARSGFRAFW